MSKLMKQISESQVLKVYSGRTSGCWCGCKGKYHYNPQFKGSEKLERGYPIEDGEFNAGMIKKVVQYVNDHRSDVEISKGLGRETVLRVAVNPIREYGVYLDGPVEMES